MKINKDDILCFDVLEWHWKKYKLPLILWGGGKKRKYLFFHRDN